MNTLTVANAANKASPTNSAGAPAAAAAPGGEGDGELDFAGLLGVGIGRTTGPEHSRESVKTEKESATVAGGETPAHHSAALLDAIAAGQAKVDPQQLSAAQIPLQAMPASIAPVGSTGAQATANDSAALPATARRSALSARMMTEGGNGMPQADTQKTATAPRATDARTDADTGPAVTAAQTAALEPAAVPVSKAELSERPQEPASVLPPAGITPGHAMAPSQPGNAGSVVARVEQLAQPFGSPAWNDGLSSHVVWMAKSDVQSAEIRLNPPDLGPVEVKLVLTGDQGAQASASVQFSAAHAATREAIESALPRLREMLLDNGIALGNATVDARTPGNTNGSGDFGRSYHGSTQPPLQAGHPLEPSIQPRPGSPLRRGNGLVDTFA